MEMMLQTQNLCKYFKKQKAVNNVSLNIEKGKIYGLLGPNVPRYILKVLSTT